MIFKLRILFHYLKTRYGLRFQNRMQLLQWQETRVLSFLKWVQKNSPFYRSWFSSVPLTEWRRIPLIDKKIMMENFSKLNTVGIRREEAFSVAVKSEATRDFSPTLNGITVGLSSGTSGNRGLFLVSEAERACHAGTILAKILPNSLFSKNRVAFFMRANSNLYTASKSSRLEFRFFDLLIPLESHFKELEALNPTLLFAPPSLLLPLARAKRRGEVRLSPLRIFSIAETLDPMDERTISEAFQQKVHQIYQCTEGFLGVTCSEGTLHLNEDCVHIEPEWLDQEQTKFMPIVTDFSRTSQPIVRYRLNDILTIKRDPCPCGSPFLAIECIEGRMDDVIYFSHSEAKHDVRVFPDFLRRAVITASDQVEEYQIIQPAPGVLKVALQCSNEARAEVHARVEENIRSLASSLNAVSPRLEFSAQIPQLRGKKLRRIHRAYALHS